MKNLGQYSVYLTGSRKTIKRCIYEQDGRTYIKWYGQIIEVVRGLYEYHTVEKY